MLKLRRCAGRLGVRLGTRRLSTGGVQRPNTKAWWHLKTKLGQMGAHACWHRWRKLSAGSITGALTLARQTIGILVATVLLGSPSGASLGPVV